MPDGWKKPPQCEVRGCPWGVDMRTLPRTRCYRHARHTPSEIVRELVHTQPEAEE